MFRRGAVALTVLFVSATLFGQTALALPPPPPQIRQAFQDRWAQLDGPVQTGAVSRTWVWGSSFTDPFYEPYHNQNTGDYYRSVSYFDKGRMEDNSWQTQQSPWNVTSGLLVEELMTGRMQTGTTEFEQKQPAQLPVAGDEGSTTTLTYAAMAPLMAYLPIPNGWTIIQTVDAHGTVGADTRLANAGVTALDVGAPTHHDVASVFWSFMNSSGLVDDGGKLVTERLFPNPFYVTGYPITEAYWTETQVGGVTKDVLVQCFERRCLTYTPGNPAGWQVEFGNVGQHYYVWRYGRRPWEG